MITFDESEYYQSPLEDDLLIVLLSFLPREAYDTLLIGRKSYVRSYYRNCSYRLAKRIRINRIRNCRIRIIEATQGEEAVEEVYPLAAGG